LSSCPAVATALLNIEPSVVGVWEILIGAYGLLYARAVFKQYFGAFGSELPKLLISLPVPTDGLMALRPVHKGSINDFRDLMRGVQSGDTSVFHDVEAVPTKLIEQIASVMPCGDCKHVTNTELRRKLKGLYPRDSFLKCDVNRALNYPSKYWGYRKIGDYKYWHRKYGDQ